MNYLRRIKKKFFEKPLPTKGWFEVEFDGLQWRFLMSNYVDQSIAHKKFECQTMGITQKIVKPGMRILDIGANIGYYTLYMAKCAGSAGKIFAFEPTQWFRERLIWHVGANGFEDRVEVIPYGLSNHPETVEIEIDNVSATLHQIRDTESEELFREKIELGCLDIFDSQFNLSPIDFVKVDIDGHEPFMLDGGKLFFEKNKPVMVIEFSQLSLDVAGSDIRDVKKHLDNWGYVLFSEKSLAPMDRRQFLCECGDFSHSANAWAIPEEKNIKKLSDLY